MSVSIVSEKLELTNILDLDVPAWMLIEEKTGIEWVDTAYGGGLTPSQTILFTGTPGAGKTSSMLQVADAITATSSTMVALYNTQEEAPLQIRKHCSRLGLRNGFYCGKDRKIPDVLAHADKIRAANPNKRLFMIIDSLQCHDDGFYSNGMINGASQVRVTEMLTAYAKSTGSIVVIIGQVNKAGDFAGKQGVKHHVDTHSHLEIDMNKKSDFFGFRIFENQKNRFGAANIRHALAMDGEGKGLELKAIIE